MSRETAAVIGAGLSGLATGIYLQRNGCDTTIFECAANSGGVSVSWKRKGFTFDGATNWVPGSGTALNFHETLAEIIDFSHFDWIDFDIFETIEHPCGEILTVYKNADLLERELIRISPADAGHIRQFMAAVRRVARVTIPVNKPFEMYNVLDWMSMPFTNPDLIGLALAWRRITINQFACRFSSEILRWFLVRILPHHGEFSVLALITSLGWLCMKAAGYPIGGSAKLAHELENVFLAEGGTIRFKSRVAHITVENNQARGIELESGERCGADLVISAADSHSTVHELLGGAYSHPAHDRAFKTWPVFPSMLQLSWGITRPLDTAVNKMIFSLNAPLQMGSDRHVQDVIVRVCNFDPTFAPPGCTALVANVRTSDWKCWTDLRATAPGTYAKEKACVADSVLDALEKRLGPLRNHCAVSDVATPATYMRYSNVWQGSYQGWFPSPTVIGKSLPLRLKGLKSFYLTGQWVVPPGGIARVIVAGRQVVQLWCRDRRRPFVKAINE